ncbi:lema family protein [Variovorax sp.]|jgi:hypothetical protein|uniref:lema family protein n=1 Tax=Variovorax sp. TaxID=1871043 RepID=UPI0012292673|nr:lema family protein [Variovorax sp.]TAJ56775.1 MAG: lema family protein [Variovorax sp.]
MSVLPDSLAGWIVVAVLLFWFVGAYNRLVRLRAAVLQAYATLDAALTRQLEFVQTSLSAPSAAEESTDPAAGASSLQAATTQMATLLGATRQRPLEAGSMSALATALQVLLTAWQRRHPDAVTSFHPDGTLSRPAGQASTANALVPVTATGAIAAEPMAWPEPSAAAEIARTQFNLAVASYNAALAQFPALLVAWAVRLRPAAPLH